MMKNITVESLLKTMQRKGYKVFDDNTKPFNLNLVGIRSSDMTPDVFNDAFCVFWKYKFGWNLMTVPCTTDAGLYYLNNPLNVKGTAIVVPDQYRGLWMLGKHQGKYTAFKQKGNVKVYRDNDGDDRYDMDNATIDEGSNFGINGHRARDEDKSTVVGKWSAGCQVIQDDADFEVLMSLAEHGSEQWGNSFTYTLLTEADLV